MDRWRHSCLLSFALFVFFCARVGAQDRDKVTPYFVTYDHYLEELDSLELSAYLTSGRAPGIDPFLGSWAELEYGARRWWTTSAYFDWQHTEHQATTFTGWRFENRFRPFLEEHPINPVIYIEYEHLNLADRTIKEVVGFDGRADLAVPVSVTQKQPDHDLDTKLILSSQIKGWNLAENFIAEKNLDSGPWEFGYAVGLSRPLSLSSAQGHCLFCRDRFIAGVEMYGGLGVWGNITLQGTSHYLAPVLIWTLPGDTSLRISPGWGLTDASIRTIVRFGVSYEFEDFSHRVRKLFH